jgi:hypothetical protein
MPEQSFAETLQCPIEALPLTDIYAALGTQPQGLTRAEAAARLQHYGRNSKCNFGVGFGLTPATDRLLVKLIAVAVGESIFMCRKPP